MSATANPKDSMKSTWRTDRSQWKLSHYLFEWLGVLPSELDRDTPKHSKQDSVPVISDFQTQRWVLFHAAIPMALNQAFVYFMGRNMHPIAAFFLYSIAFKLIAIHELHCTKDLGHIYGFFDGDQHERDEVPDHSVGKIFASLIQTSTYRPMLAVLLSYRTSQTPASTNWAWLPLEVGLYGIILDFWFYWYHRIMHEVDGLWKYHRTHHLTKHPNPLLTLYADSEQEFWDIAGIPLLTYGTMKLMGMPMGFYEWWICHQYIVFAELFGHSGVRIAGVPPSPFSWLLRATGTELYIEDHDLHHRRGWKKSGNYGKQTRLWDTIFGTCRDRIECIPENIDHDTVVYMPFISRDKPPSLKETWELICNLQGSNSKKNDGKETGTS